MEQAQHAETKHTDALVVRSHWNSAIERQRRGDTRGAIADYERHLQAQPEDIGGWTGLATALRRSGSNDAALVCLQRALRLAPRDASVWSQLGALWMELGQCQQALRSHRHAMVLAPLRIDLRLRCAAALREMQQFTEAEALIEECLEREPGRADLLLERALLCLHTGRWREAWPDYEARLRNVELPSCARGSARWAGERIGGKRVLLIEEQGAGFSLWAARYIALLARRGAALSLMVDARLHPLLTGLPVRLLAVDDDQLAQEHFDFHCSLMSLPWLVDPRGATIPEPTALTLGDAPGAASCNDESELRIGIAWCDEQAPVSASRRAPGLERFLALASLPGVQLHSLQQGPAARELGEGAAAGLVVEPAAGCGDYVSLAATIEPLDLVVCSDGAVAHLAGCLGKPVLNLLAFTPYWIWGTRGDSTPWYPSMRLLRQREAGSWGEVFDEVLGLVRGWAQARRREARRAARAREGKRTWF